MMKLIKLSFVLVAILSLGIMVQSCKSKKDALKTDYPSEKGPNITGTWILKSLNGQQASTIFKGKIPTMNIETENNRISGNGGCNTYTGTYTYTKGILSAPNLTSTMMMCPDGDQESLFHAMIGQSNKISVANNTILTLSNNGKTVAEFVKGIDTSVLSAAWKLESIADGDMQTLFTDQTPTISFNTAENRLGGNGGCNTYNATYKIEGTTITVGPVIATRMACLDIQGESKFTQIITGPSTLEATADKLTFSKEGKVTLTFVKDVK